MKVYLATSGEPGEYDYEVLRAFARKEDAEAYERGSRVEEFDVAEGPVEVRTWHVLVWGLGENQEPKENTELRDFDGDTSTVRAALQGPARRPYSVVVEGWDLQAVRDRFAAERAQYVEMRNQSATEYVAGLDRIEVQVWYETGGRAVLKTPIHNTNDHFTVPRERITEQAGLAPGATLHGGWFTVETLTFTDAQGFTVCAAPSNPTLAG